ncbi:polynucleotide adenylyltransferase PcnB [Alteromonas mediterranea]|jgi:poly(A) polymerase|uniref:Poly(A) polymerase I n=2 Tax=Alteromonas mediterranea TaxID=314275 RepID=A0AAC9NTE0_9ALTE|nr:polynucleotide adenylyltransferase PcnB [Alteromonas mediterranea]AGP79387.1 poly(A) polymerase I [Alteromonas mediterranea 615]MDY6882787.1 polynucleotide adenylyltransferase PcnB [Pseudomonadota bacterium]AFV87159.1 poly(A) polymerase I [Alteromonas mediterranea DE1]AGP83408.1 poly(A) polymerase I [Alteromonas mediterranea MED64]AGP99175.1 poly(A) polymerase I [Alteromonas mediterranea UM7]|tara:strand:- start:1510 stop:2829 length:1320 start_codon:yes stop_codon:yes gene_type:complete
MTRGEHGISREDISANALKVMYRLNGAGFESYLVGGCVRDILMGHEPKDFDVATNATPEQIKGLFKNCRLIGRRFRLAHIVFGREIIEVATFRGHHQESDEDENVPKAKVVAKRDSHGQLVRDNVFGSIEEDAERRDFTFNAMYYSVADFTVTDFANGLAAIEKREVELIGDPETRYREDPVRMLRAVRFAVKLGMRIEEKTAEPIKPLANLLQNIPPARLFEETLKLFLSGKGEETFLMLHEYGLIEPLFPQLAPFLKDENSREMQFVRRVLANTDERINSNQRVTPAFLYAALLWYPVEEQSQRLQSESGLNAHDAFNIASGEVISRQTQRIMIPKRFSTVVRDIWILQQRLPKRFGRRAFQLLTHPKFRAGYDFLLVRGQVEGGDLLELAQWWTHFQHADNGKQKGMLNALRKSEGGGKGGPRKRKRKPAKRGPDA